MKLSLPKTGAKGAAPSTTDTPPHTAHAPTATRVSAGEHIHQYLSECAAHEAVYEEVDARVEGEEKVADDIDCP